MGLKDKSIVIFGYGSQGRSHALNLHESGMNVSICLPESSESIADVKLTDLRLYTNHKEAAKNADAAVFMVPDSVQKKLYESIEENLPLNSTLVFAHGLTVHYKIIKPRDDMDVILAAPLAQGDEVRKIYTERTGLPVVIAVSQNVTGRAWQIAREYAAGIGATDGKIIESTFKEETETDLFTEQALIVGGLWRLITSAFEVLIEEGYQPEIAYYCCLKETRIMANMFARLGILETFRKISGVARFGALSRGPRIIDEHVKEQMKKVLCEIRGGKFIEDFEEEDGRGGDSKSRMMLKQLKSHALEVMHRKMADGEW